MKRDDGRISGAVKVGNEGEVMSGKVSLSRALRQQALREQEARRKETGGEEATKYEWVEDYDPVLRSHCRIR